MIDRDRQLADQRQAGVLQQIVDVVDGAGAGVFNRHHGVFRLAGLDLVKNVGKLELKPRIARLLFFMGDISPFDSLFLPAAVIIRKLPNLINKIIKKIIKKRNPK